MTILDTDIKLLESERMSDAADGGGRMTSNAIVSGQLSNIFPKVSRTDSVYGRVNLRKVYAAVRSATLDMYGGAHAILIDAPDDPKINATIFSTGSAFDTRTAARDRIESYVVVGALSRMRLYGNQIVGAKAITTYQRLEEPLPEVGEVYCLSVESGDVVTVSQYVRVTDVTHEVRTFTDPQYNVDFERRVITLKLAATLTQTFVGAEPTRGASDPAPTRVRGTLVADASKYYGIAPVVGALAQSALQCELVSVHAALVPSTSRETAVSLAEIPGAHILSPSGPAKPVHIHYATSSDLVHYTLQLHYGVMPGSFRMTYSDLQISLDLRDESADGVLTQHGANNVVATLDHENGVVEITFVGWNPIFSTIVAYCEFTPATAVDLRAHTRAIKITLATRGSVYVETLIPAPAPGAVVVEYRAQGKWYRLTDDRLGALGGDSSALGSGSVDYVTGGLVVTLGALPDIDSAVVVTWGSPIHVEERAGTSADAGTTVRHTVQLPHKPIAAGSLSFDYRVNNNVRTVTANASGVLSGSGVTGSVDHANGIVRIEYTEAMPDFGLLLDFDYMRVVPQTQGEQITQTAQVVCDGARHFNLGMAITAGSLRGTIDLTGADVSFLAEVKDNGSGGLVTATGYASANMTVAAGQVIGTVNYATGDVAATTAAVMVRMENVMVDSGPYPDGMPYQPPQREWRAINHNAQATIGASGSWVWQNVNQTATDAISVQIDPSLQPPAIDLTRTSGQAVIPGSVCFLLFGRRYYDNGQGVLYSVPLNDLLNHLTPVASGSVDYAQGVCALEYWEAYSAIYATALNLTVESCLTGYGDWIANEAYFRTAGSPLRPSSLFVQVTAADGAVLTATADESGVVSSAAIEGTVNYQNGIVALHFGAWVTAAGNEAEVWYAANKVVNGLIFKPRDVLPATIKYNCVVLSNLPLDPVLLGLDPVRLPMDGRVPIFRAGDIIVHHHTASANLPNPVTPGNSYSLGIGDLALVTLADGDGDALPAALWSVNLATGTVVIAADANLSGYTQPLVATYRFEQMNLCTDVQIDGQISFAIPLTRAFPSGTLCSSALAFGDLVAHVSNVFDQATWDGTWSDTLRGAQATGQFNDIDYPIEVLNDGAVSERWRISFTGATAFNVIGENLGQVASGTTASDVQVTNPLTGKAYFTLRAAGWGSGWATGNQLRFNTIGPNAPIWIARTVLGGAGLGGDALTLEVRGDTD